MTEIVGGQIRYIENKKNITFIAVSRHMKHWQCGICLIVKFGAFNDGSSGGGQWGNRPPPLLEPNKGSQK